jgi:hypothetical protein
MIGRPKYEYIQMKHLLPELGLFEVETAIGNVKR